MLNWRQLQDQALIGLLSIAIQHIQNEDYESAESTLFNTIRTLEVIEVEA